MTHYERTRGKVRATRMKDRNRIKKYTVRNANKYSTYGTYKETARLRVVRTKLIDRGAQATNLNPRRRR